MELPGGIGLPDLYDVVLVLVGVGLLLISLGRTLFERLNLNSTFVYLGVGMLVGPLLFRGQAEEALQVMPILERVAEFAVIVSLIVMGIRIGRPLEWRAWRSTARLVLVLMPATIAAVAALGVLLLGLPLGPAILLGAVLAPTDPILAGPLEEDSTTEDPEDRFGLSSEAGLNDGLAFPFIYLGLYVTLQPDAFSDWGATWLLRDVAWAVGAALPLGWLAGHGCGRLYIRQLERDAVSHQRHLFVPLALLLATYGFTEMVGAYGFLAAFTAGLGFRGAVAAGSDRLERFADFTESVDELAKAAALGMLGALLPWQVMLEKGWPAVGVALLLVVVLRPGLTWAATAGGGFSASERGYWAWFGIRGIGSIYYMSYAINRGLDDDVAAALFAIVSVVILTSVLLHGLSVRPYMHRFKGAGTVEE